MEHLIFILQNVKKGILSINCIALNVEFVTVAWTPHSEPKTLDDKYLIFN
jgi:hypothetical protein